MSRIRILDPQVAAQIAAGEVITRPAAVVKELVENALDAGARTITVTVADGGASLIRVVDDGCGMTPEEVPLSLRRHATSKLAAETDLLSIQTLGFRGEALPSIATVSRLTLTSCPPGAKAGFRLVAQAGEILEAGPAAAASGTTVEVAELFFNTPARRKFLKSPDAERAQILEALRSLALGYPQVHFALATPSRTLLAAPGPVSLLERVAAVWKAELAAHMLPVCLGEKPWQVAGLISEPDFTLGTARFQVFLVNGRVVQDRLLGAALREVYAGLVPRGRHPAALISLSLPPEAVDVNVHPAKTEIRFQEPGRLYPLLLTALRRGLGPLHGEPPRYTVSFQPEPPPRAAETPGQALFPWQAAPAAAPPPFSFPAGGAAPLPAAAPGPRGWRFQDLTVIGQLALTYILAQGPDGLILIDQHAAHERVLYETLKAKGPAAVKQTLLFPRVVEIPPAQADWVGEHLEALAQAGLVLEPFGGASFLITAAPACLAAADLEAVVAEAVEALAPAKSLSRPQEVREQALTYMACRGAIKAGDPLAPEEIGALLAQLDEIPVSSHCPHGRPLWRVISYQDIRQSFRR
ncbi:MAG: DNA mismatch repair endonuclease MutL [Syntrophobacterales bacterium]|nr:DNA mismatch repair endonuclease MutL [Syntrophobacterales bacterium]